ncbi:MAG TPA: AIPR family protein [Candidatus Brocadiaceae bacterium]|nr:AIPR family protein [Candidatus Brocadiaceae bacterium]
MDLITESCVKEFIKTNELTSDSESFDFERFASFCLVAKEYNNSFNIDDILTDEDTQGIDGIGIIVNGRLVNDIQEVQDLIEANGFLETTFIFIQAKTTPKFEGSEIGNFAFSVKEFFNPSSKIYQGPRMRNFLDIKKIVYDNASRMRSGSPICKMYYVTTGSWVDDCSLVAVIDRNKQEIFATNLFKEVLLDPCDAKAIQAYYRKTKDKVTATFLFEKKVTLPSVTGIKEAYFGMLPFTEFAKLLIDDTDTIRNIFYDNIRDFLGIEASPVNQKISETIKEGKHDLFSVLNNGVTVVADGLNKTGDMFTLTDYQIVNGCQTSHVLYENRRQGNMKNVYIPLRIIVTQEDNIKNQITKATNSQTAIKPEQLEALSQFQKDLEQYYNAVGGDGRLYYERRSNQYNTNSNVPKAKIISIPIQIKSFAAMFLEVPHLVSGYYGTIAKRLGDQIFKEGHKYIPYYTSGLAYYRLESLFKSRQVDTKYKKARHHIILILRLLCQSYVVPNFNSKDIEKYCDEIIRVLNSENELLSKLQICTQRLESSGIDYKNQSQLKQKETTTALINASKKS